MGIGVPHIWEVQLNVPQFVGDDKLSIQRIESTTQHNHDLAFVTGSDTLDLWAECGLRDFYALIRGGFFLIVKGDGLTLRIDRLEFLNKALRSSQPMNKGGD